jgi:hypothetical protein
MRVPDRMGITLWHCRLMVWAAAWLVPHPSRAEWCAAQNHKFWHWCHFLAEAQRFNAHNQLLIARASWALFPEVFWLRFDRESFSAKWRQVLGSPATLLLGGGLALALLTAGSGIVTAARAAFTEPVPNADRIVTITLDGNGINGKYGRIRSDTLLDLSAVWTNSRLAEGVAPFSWAPGTLLLPNRDLPVATARVGEDFFHTLGVRAVIGRVFAANDLRNCPGCLVLSYPTWQREFLADPSIVGKPVDLNGVPRTVIGVLPPEFRLLSPAIAAWGLIDPAILFTNFQRRVGAVARLHGSATPGLLQRDLSDLTESAGYVHPSSQLQVVSVAMQLRRTLLSTGWFVLLATGCAILVVLLRRWSSGVAQLPEGASARVRWIGFLLAKSLLLLGLSAILAWSLVHWIAVWNAVLTYPIADGYSTWLYLPLAIVALSWGLLDQRWRCRKCLCRLELPVEIGRTGSVLLNWAGTEMVCPKGHGVLYLPDSPENVLDKDRWSELDESWQSLFRES